MPYTVHARWKVAMCCSFPVHVTMCWMCVLAVHRQLRHSNVVELVGVVITVQPPSMVLVSEWMGVGVWEGVSV